MTKDVDIDEVKIGLETPLTNAIKTNKNTQKIEELIGDGENPNVYNIWGETPLGIAVQYGDIDTITLLLKNGADVNQETRILQEINNNPSYNAKPLEIAIKTKNILAIDLLRKYADIKIEYAIMAIVEDNAKEIIEPIIEHLNDIDEKDNDGMTLLMYAAESNKHKEVIELLFNKGADVDKTNNKGMTPLMLAIQNDNIREVCGTLINKCHANIKIRDNKGYCALDYAKEINRNDLMQLLDNK